MAKNTIRTYSTTAASNTDVGGVDIQGTAPASNMDDSVREVMSHLAETNAGTAPVDDTWSFCDPADATKKFRFDGGNITAGQTRVLSVGDNDATLGNIPVSNDSAALGSASKSWSDLFLASGGVLNWNNGNITITHSSGALTMNGGDFVLGGSLELGHATDTTLSRGAAGFMAVEGKRVPSPASQAAGDVLYRGSTEWERLAKGTALQTLRMNSGATAPEWATPVFSNSFESAEQACTANTEVTVAHSLGAVPKLFFAVLRCKSAEFNYAVGDEVMVMSSLMAAASGSNLGNLIIAADSTNLVAVINVNGIQLPNKTGSSGSEDITEANWRLVIRAWA